MQKDDKTIIFFVGLFLIVGLLGELLFYLDVRQFAFITRKADILGRLGGLFLFLRQGTLIKSRPFFLLTIIFICIVIIGAITKILHWQFNNIILPTGLIGIPIIYFIHFVKKQDKHRLDILKLIWVTVYFTSTIFVTQHFPYGKALNKIEWFLFLLMFADYFFTNYRLDRSGQIQDKKINVNSNL